MTVTLRMEMFLLCTASMTASADLRDIVWELGPKHPELRKGGCLAAVGGKVVSVFGMRHPWGEMNTMYVYDPAGREWTRGPDAPVGQTYVEGAELAGTFCSVGGRMRQVHRRCFRMKETDAGHEWTELPKLNEARGWAPSVAVGKRLYVFGGSKGGHGPTLGSVESLDTEGANGKWVLVSQIPGPSRGWCTAAAVGGKVYLIGGAHFFDPKPERGDDRKRLNEVLEFDPVTNEWQQRKPLPFALSGMDSCVYKDRYVIVVGGAPNVGEYSPEMRDVWQQAPKHKQYYCPFVLVYDAKGDSWSRMPSPLPMPTNDIRMVLLGDRLFALGGENVDPATSNTTDWLRIGQIVEEAAE